MSNLEAYCDRQTPDSCGIVEETIGANRKVVKSMTKVLSMLNNHVGAANDKSKKTCGDANKALGGARKGIVFQELHVARCHV